MSAGNNPMRWKCDVDGCFNVVKRPKIEVFHGCFPGRINFGDVDGIVEVHGLALMLEWKPAPVALKPGQQIMYERLSKDGKISVLVLAGDAETMAVTHSRHFWAGRQSDWVPSSIERAREFCSRWNEWAKGISTWRKDYAEAEQKYWPDTHAT